MLAHLGEREASARLHKAIYKTYAERDCLTGDVGGKASTTEFAEAVIRHVRG
jgi:isocitrate dehydrogenase (NAD+)